MSLSSLQVLAKNRNALLLAEVAAWLHDMGKCADEHIIKQASDGPSDYSYKYKTAQIGRLPATLPDINLFGEAVSVKELIEQGVPRVISDTNRPWLLRALGKCHAVSHVEKELGDRDTATKQPKDDTRLSTAFGIEGSAVTGLTALLDALPFDNLTNRASFVPKVAKTFDRALGDTRRPVNEVTLADWSGTVAAFYKSALASALLGVKPDPDALRWRLLRVNFDVLGLYAKAVKIADLLAYQNAVSEACQKIKQLVEEEYPLGNEIYRDTTGIYFTFPDLDLPAELEQEIRRCVEDVEPELAPRIAVTVGDGATAQEQLKGILAKARKEALQALAQPFDAHTLSPSWRRAWEQALREAGKWEVCPVCRLSPKEEHAEVCKHCEQRRTSRLETWKQQPAHTIWLGEIADHNDRVALLVGKFGLDDWLSGEMVQTMLVKMEQNNPAGCTPKNPSPARLRRVWETCQRFWDDAVLQGILSTDLDNHGQRKLIVPPNKTNWQEGLYNGKVNGKPLDLFWQPERNAFLTVSSLPAAGEFKMGDTVTLERPETKHKAEFEIQEAPDAFPRYHPYLTLHASPDQFLAFIPAADALEIAHKIRNEYEKQFGKVRNRLPLFLGLIYFERKIPLLAVMDAARVLLDSQQSAVNSEQWTVKNIKEYSANNKPQSESDRQKEKECNQKAEQKQTRYQLTLVKNDHTITLCVPTTEDLWYPYWRVEGKPTDRTRWFVGPDGEHWVHVTELRKEDVVQFTPSTFDFLYLDTAVRRFALAYDDSGRRLDRPSRPYYLEDLDRLDRVWEAFSQLSRTQLKQTLQTIETARERWFGRDEGRKSADDDTFKQFVADTLAVAQWDWKAVSDEQKSLLITAAARGELTDLAELHLEILKE